MSVLLFPALSSNSASSVFLTDLNGKSFDYEQIIDQPQVVIMLWTTWCHFCRENLKDLTCEEIGGTSAKIYFINIGEKKSKVDEFLKTSNIIPCVAGNILLDKAGIVAKKLRVPGIPAYIFFQQGKVLYQSHYVSKNLLDEVFNEK